MLRRVTALAVVALIAGSGVLVACGDDGGDVDAAGTEQIDLSGESTSSTPGADEQAGELADATVSPLPPGRWTTGLTMFPVTFTATEGWHLDAQAPFGFVLSREAVDPTADPDLPVAFTFTMLADAEAFTETMPDLEGTEYPIPEGTLDTEPIPDDVVAWLGEVEHLELGAPEPVRIGGLDGQVMDFGVPTLPEEPVTSPEGGPQCLWLFAGPEELYFLACEGAVGRYYVLDHSSGPVIIAVEGSPGPELDAFQAAADELLGTVVIG